MPNSIRNFALVAVLSLIAAPTMRAERFGTNPHPSIASPAMPTTLETLAYTVSIYMGV